MKSSTLRTNWTGSDRIFHVLDVLLDAHGDAQTRLDLEILELHVHGDGLHVRSEAAVHDDVVDGLHGLLLVQQNFHAGRRHAWRTQHHGREWIEVHGYLYAEHNHGTEPS